MDETSKIFIENVSNFHKVFMCSVELDAVSTAIGQRESSHSFWESFPRTLSVATY